METVFYIFALVILTFLTACGVIANGVGHRTFLSTMGQVLYGGMFLTCLYIFSCI